MEALLFAFRAIGSEISPTENKILPQIQSFLLSLKFHPKIRYAVTLVIGRYAEWTRNHPEYIGQQLSYISEGFSDPQIAPASAMSLKYLCESCGNVSYTYDLTLTLITCNF